MSLVSSTPQIGSDPPQGALLLLHASDSEEDEENFEEDEEGEIINRRGSVNTQILGFLEEDLDSDVSDVFEDEEDDPVNRMPTIADRFKKAHVDADFNRPPSMINNHVVPDPVVVVPPSKFLARGSWLLQKLGLKRKNNQVEPRVISVASLDDGNGATVASGQEKLSKKQLNQIRFVTVVGTSFDGQHGKLRFAKNKLFAGKCYDVYLESGKLETFDGTNLEKFGIHHYVQDRETKCLYLVEGGEYYFVTRAKQILDTYPTAHSAGIRRTICRASAVSAHIAQCADAAAAYASALALNYAASVTAVAVAQVAAEETYRMMAGFYTQVAILNANTSWEQAWEAVREFCIQTENSYVRAANDGYHAKNAAKRAAGLAALIATQAAEAAVSNFNSQMALKEAAEASWAATHPWSSMSDSQNPMKKSGARSKDVAGFRVGGKRLTTSEKTKQERMRL